MAGKRIRIYDRTRWNDIRYRGPFSYRHLMIFGWICISFHIVAVMIDMGLTLNPGLPEDVYILSDAFRFFSSLSLPLFLFANFAVILDRKYTYKAQMLKFGGLSALIIALFILFKEHYIVGILTAVLEDRTAAEMIVDEVLLDLSLTGKLSFNLFIDLFLCTLLMFFLNYDPKRFFTGKKRVWFRLLAILPILYEMGSLALRVSMAFGLIRPHYLLYPFMTTKPLMSFVLFVILAFHIKFQERRFVKHGKSRKDYRAYTQTNSHSLRFSIFSCVMILITSVIDLFLRIFSYFIAMIPRVIELAETESESAIIQVTETDVVRSFATVDAWGIGKHVSMLTIIPVILLFSYNRNHKNPQADKLIPAGGIILATFMFLESLYRVIVMNLPAVTGYLQDMVNELTKGA